MSQLELPTEVTPAEIGRERTLGGALELCAKAAGYDLDKQLQSDLDCDKGQFSRWKNDSEGIRWVKLLKLMDLCGNHAPVLWMLHQLGYDITSLRKRESELERELRVEREEKAKMQMRLDVLEEVAGIKRTQT